jgi:hypothetical protein
MKTRTPLMLLVAISTLALAGIAVIVVDASPRRADQKRSAEFQRLVGGLGFGPALDLSRCAFSFDPRIEGDCHWNTSPIPGGFCFCLHHGSSIFYYPQLSKRRGEDGTEDAQVP